MNWETELIRKAEDRSALVGIVGLGYVGLPLAVEFAAAGFRVVGFDRDPAVVAGVAAGRSHIPDVPSEGLTALVGGGRLRAEGDLGTLAGPDLVAICVPTPLSKTRDPDVSYISEATESVAAVLRRGQLVVLESTTYPGTTRELVLPALGRGGLVVGRDFFLAFSPERVDPGNPTWQTRNTPKIVGGLTPACTRVALALYQPAIERLVPVSSPEAAELVKLLENTFRSVNIGLVNEMAIVCDKLGVDVWEVIEAAATKPFGFMKFKPGPGLGGHCIPVDPHYLSWKMRALNYKTRFIEVASEVNSEMPAFWVNKVVRALNDRAKAVRGSTVLVVGVAYKRDVPDVRESPALDVIRLLEQMGAKVRYHDPYVSELRGDGAVLHSSPLSRESLSQADCVVIVTDHSDVDYRMIAEASVPVVDTRHVIADRRPEGAGSGAGAG